MQFIDDGYTLRASLLMGDSTKAVVEFRPMLARERKRMLSLMGGMSEAAAWLIADTGLSRHIITGDEGIVRQELLAIRQTNFSAWRRIFDLVTNYGNDRVEEADRRNLESGVPLLRRFGHLSGGDTCDICRQFLFDPEKGELERDDETGDPIPRFDEAVLACQTREGCPNGTPDNPRSLSRKNRLAFRHYQECLAVSHFPDDPIVRQNAAIIRSALLRCQRPVTHANARYVDVLVPLHERPGQLERG